MATRSTPCFRPNSRSLRSLSVSAGMVSATPGRLMPWCSPSMPPLTTSQSTSCPRRCPGHAVRCGHPTAGCARPASLHAPGQEMWWRCRSGVPGTSRGVMVTREPVFRSDGLVPLQAPSADFGALQVLQNADGASFALRRRPAKAMRYCAHDLHECRARNSGARRPCRGAAGRAWRASVLQAGPMVQMILARRGNGLAGRRRICRSAVACWSWNLSGDSNRAFPFQVSCSLGHLQRQRRVQAAVSVRRVTSAARGPLISMSSLPSICARKQHGIEFRADQDHKRDHVHPHQQRDADPERAVDDAVIGEALQVPAEHDGRRRTTARWPAWRRAARCAKAGCAERRCDRSAQSPQCW